MNWVSSWFNFNRLAHIYWPISPTRDQLLHFTGHCGCRGVSVEIQLSVIGTNFSLRHCINGVFFVMF